MEKVLDKAAALSAAALGTLPRIACSVSIKARKEARKATQKASKALAKAKRAKASRRAKEKARRKEKENLVEFISMRKLTTTTLQVLLRLLHG